MASTASACAAIGIKMEKDYAPRLARKTIQNMYICEIMANTYTQIYLHIVFAVKGRVSCIPPFALPRDFSYMYAIASKMKHNPIVVGGTPDHIHMLIGYNPAESLPELVKEIKIGSGKFINGNGYIGGRFEWQRGYAAISCSHSHVESVKDYIRGQMEHHRGVTLRDEIIRIYKKNGVDIDERYVFEDV